jgi:thioesterase domain-containing protein/GT2 family glycosyltransferase
MLPLVSVVMPCFNAGRMLEPALWSVFAQSYPNIEFIFVDNNSTDGSAERARSFAAGKPRPFRLVHCPDQGANRARNMGYALARGDYIQWLDADDALGIEKIAAQVEALERDREASIAYCDWMSSRHLPDGRRLDKVVWTQADDQILRSLSGRWYPPHSYLVRREAADVLQAEQAWLPETTIGTDVEYSAIAALLGMRLRHVPSAKVQYNTWSTAQISGSETPYPARVAAFRRIWARLREFARRPDVAPRLTAQHKMLLDQDWTVWSMPLGSVEIGTLSAQRHALRHVVSGRSIEVGPREATVATVLLAMGLSRAFLHHALLVAEASPALNNDLVGIFSMLEQFRREGLLTAVDLAAEAEGDRDEAVAAQALREQEPSVGVEAALLAPADATAALPHRTATADTRKLVAKAWTEVLQGRGLEEDQRFDAAGGDSIALLNLALSCEASLGVPVSLDALSVRMRPSDIARVLDRILSETPATAADLSAAPSELPTIFLVRARHQIDPSEAILHRVCAGLARIVPVPLPAWPKFVEPHFDYGALLDRLVGEIEPRVGEAPVMLFGLCYGGMLAYLVAQRLAGSGRRVGFLGIVDGDPSWALDAIPANIVAGGRALRRDPWIPGLANSLAKWLMPRPRALLWLSRNERMALLPRNLAAHLNWRLNIDMPAWFDRAGFLRSLRHDGVLDAPVFVFRSLEQAEATPADLHWRDLCSRVTVVPVLGEHYTLFAPHNLPVLHHAVGHAMRQALAGVTPVCALSSGSPAEDEGLATSLLSAPGHDGPSGDFGVATAER